MKDAMRSNSLVESEFKEKQGKQLSERRERAMRYIDEWSKVEEVGKGLKESYDRNPRMIENTAIVLENMANEFSKLNETQISSAYNGLTPENALRVVRLGYPNSKRGSVFHEFAMETAQDGIWYLSPTYGSTKRDATAGNTTHESSSYRYTTLEELDVPTQTPNGSITTFTGSDSGALANPPLKVRTIRLYEQAIGGIATARTIVAQDDGAGVISGTSADYGAITGTINYTTGAISVTFATAPDTGIVLNFGYIYDYEDPTQYTDLGDVELSLRKVNFDLRSYRLGLSWSKQSELTLGTTLNIDAEEALIKGASEELKKSLDYEAFKLGYYVARGNGAFKVFDTDYLSKGVDSPQAHAQTLDRVFEDTADQIRAELNRGGYSSIIAGSQAANYISSYLNKFSTAGADSSEIGVYQIGTYAGNKPVIKVPDASIMPVDEIYLNWNNAEAGDMSIAFGTLLPMYQSPKIEYKNMNSELGLAEWGDHRILQEKYIRGIQLSNLSSY